jgi:hypothetical protein
LYIPALQKIITYHTYDIDRNLLLGAYTTLTTRDEPISIEEGRQLGLETALLLARAREIARLPVHSGKKSGNARSAVNLAGHELDVLIKDLFHLSLPDVGVERPATPQTPTGRGTPTGGRNTPQLGIQTNGSPAGSNSLRGGSVMNAYPALSSHADFPVQVQAVPPMVWPTARSTAEGIENKAAPTLPPEPRSIQAAGPVGRVYEGVRKGSGLPNDPEPKGKEAAAAEASRSDLVMHLDISKRGFYEKRLCRMDVGRGR